MSGSSEEDLKKNKNNKLRHVNDKQPHGNDRPKEGKLLNLFYETNITGGKGEATVIKARFL